MAAWKSLHNLQVVAENNLILELHIISCVTSVSAAHGPTAMSKTLAYLAGVIDSDGCITIKRRRVKTAAKWNMSSTIFVRQVTREAIHLLHETFGGSVRVNPPSTHGGRDLFQWTVDRTKATAAAMRLLPYLRIKRQQAMILVEFAKFLSDPRKRCAVTYFKWEDDEACYTVEQAAGMKGISAASVYQAVGNNSIPSKLMPGLGRGKRLIPKRFWDSYVPSFRRNLPDEYLNARDEFRARIHSLNGPTRGVASASRAR